MMYYWTLYALQKDQRNSKQKYEGLSGCSPLVKSQPAAFRISPMFLRAYEARQERLRH